MFSQGDQLNSFKEQARRDFSQFLKHRSCELVVGGVLIISIVCINNEGSCGSNPAKRLLYNCTQSLSLTPQELLNYTITEYPRTYDECIDHELFNQYAFELVKAQFSVIESELFSQSQNKQITADEFARAHTQFMCSWSESASRKALELTGERSHNDIDELLTQFWSIYEHDSQSYRTLLVLKKSQLNDDNL